MTWPLDCGFFEDSLLCTFAVEKPCHRGGVERVSDPCVSSRLSSVQVLEGSDLVGSDYNGLSDPFVAICVLTTARLTSKERGGTASTQVSVSGLEPRV